MRNRAKCKKCGTVIESLTAEDWVYCQCHEIGISGGKENYRCIASDFADFLRVDDDGNEIIVKVKEVESKVPDAKEHLEMLNDMIKNIEALPEYAKQIGINHYDFLSLLYLLKAMFRSKA